MPKNGTVVLHRYAPVKHRAQTTGTASITEPNQNASDWYVAYRKT